MHDSEQPDEALRAAYRGMPREEPPPAIDAAVLGAARQGVAKRSHQWRVPVALAAVVVLSVAVTLRVADEQPEIRMTTPSAPRPGEAAKPTTSNAESKADTPDADPRSQTKTQVRPASPPARPLARQEPHAPAKEETVVTAPPTFVPSPQADSSEQRQGPVAPAVPAPGFGQSAGQLAQPGARADRAAPMMARKSAEASNLASGASVLAPEAWLERIIELRASARHKEADESYAEFRRSYPEYPIPPEKLEKIAPRR